MCGYGGLPGPLVVVVMIHFEFDLFWFIPGWSIMVMVFWLVVSGCGGYWFCFSSLFREVSSMVKVDCYLIVSLGRGECYVEVW